MHRPVVFLALVVSLLAGPTGPPMSPGVVTRFFTDVSSNFFGRTLSIGEIDDTGKAVIVPIDLVPHRDEVAVSFTLEYDPSRYGKPQVMLAGRAPVGSILTVNDTQKGRIGILVDSTEAFTASAIPRRFVQVEFLKRRGSVEKTAFSITGSAAPISISNIDGKTLVHLLTRAKL
ncbi:MAG: hypothetical protein AB7J13_04190 [Pyrinomonadaceae bacterium]